MTPVKKLAVNSKLYNLPNTHFKGLVLHCATWLVVYIAAESLAKLALPTTKGQLILKCLFVAIVSTKKTSDQIKIIKVLYHTN